MRFTRHRRQREREASRWVINGLAAELDRVRGESIVAVANLDGAVDDLEIVHRRLGDMVEQLQNTQAQRDAAQELASELDTAHRAALHDLEAARREITRLEGIIIALDPRKPAAPNGLPITLCAELDVDRCG